MYVILIYLDNCSTTKLSEKVKQNIVENLDLFANPSSMYDIGINSKKIINDSRRIIADCINCKPNEIYFTSGASESNSWALQENFYCEDYEHHSILNNKKRVKDLLDAKIVSYMLVNNEVGFINDIKSIRKEYKNHQFHCDATQAIGNIKVDVKDLNVDTMSFSGHKFHAPKGIGVLYIKNGIKLKPLIYGGKQEFKIRGGTENIIGISAIGVAIEESIKNLKNKQDKCKVLKNKIVENLKNYNIDYVINGKNTINSILNISIKNIESEAMLLNLYNKEIYLSGGSACNSGSLEPSETLTYLNCPKEYINGVLRISLDYDNTIEEINYFCKELNIIINRLKFLIGEY